MLQLKKFSSTVNTKIKNVLKEIKHVRKIKNTSNTLITIIENMYYKISIKVKINNYYS